MDNMIVFNKAVATSIFLITLASCNAFIARPTKTPIVIVTSLPTLTATSKPTNTPTPTIEPTETSSPVVFPTSTGKIAFISYRDGNEEIYLMNADGTEQTNLTRNSADDGLPVWSPDDSRIAFVSDRSGELDVYVVNADGLELRNLTNHSAIDTSPIWSPDGKQIAFISDRDGHEEVYTMNADGSQQIRLTHDPNTKGEPSWSPDGKLIAFTYNDFDNYNWDIYVVNVENAVITRLTDDPEADTTPSWSPDGKYIYFISGRDRGRSLYKMYPNGSQEVRVVWPWVGPMEQETWSPTKPYFATTWAPFEKRKSIYIFNPDGTEYHQLTDGTLFNKDSSPNWSPAGQHLAFSSNKDGNSEIYVIKIDGTELIRLTNDNDIDQSPIWQPIPILSH
jgi:Tol biopolymer transport system component